MRVAQHGPAHTQDHWTMPLDQAGEGQFGAIAVPVGESLEELPIRESADRPGLE